MATETIIKCDLTGKVIADGSKFDPEAEIPLISTTGGVLVKIVVPEGFDCDRNALFTAIGNLVPKKTRTRKLAEPPTPPAEPKHGKNKPGDGPVAE